MLRRLTIGIGALGLVLVVYGLYRGGNPAPAKPVLPVPTSTLALGAASAPVSQQQSLPGTGGVTFAPGSIFNVTVFDSKGQPQYLLRAEEWSPSGQDGSEIHVVGPSLSKFMPDGQILQVTAKEGQIIIVPTGKDNVKPKRGTLSNNVEIRIDLTTRQWRLDHPGEEAMDAHPQHLIRIQMDSLFFDEDLSLIRTDGPVKVHCEKYDVESKGLRLVYDRTRDRLERLEILQGGTVELRGTVDLESSPLLAGKPAGKRKPVASQPQAEMEAVATSQPSAGPSTQEADVVAAAPPRFVDVYQARFEGPVQMRQLRGEQVVARLDADELLELTFDTGPRSRGNAELSDAGDEQASGQIASQPAAIDTSKAVMTWAGRLDITPVERRSLDKAGRTTTIRAVGQRVVLADEDNTIDCSELQYDAARRTGRIMAPAPAMARIGDSRGQYLAGHDIRFDQSGTMSGTLDIVGAGEAGETTANPSLAGTEVNASSPENLTRIQWHKGLQVRFRRASLADALGQRLPLPLQMPGKSAAAAMAMYQGLFEIPQARQSQSLGAGPLKGLTARGAVITGNALVQRGEESICSERLEVDFFPGSGEGQVFGPIRSTKGAGGVCLTGQAGSGGRQPSSITSDELDVQFELASGHRSNPARALATGRAVVVEGSTKIEADRIDATLKPVADVPTGKFPASRPAKSKGQQKVAVTDLLADGNVRINDPKRPLNLTAGHLKAAIDGNQTITQVQVDGSPTQPAAVATSEYDLVAPSIQGDLRSQDVTVPSSGELTLMLNQDLQGQRLTKAQRLKITWADHMRIWGDKNLAEFVGNVQAVQTNPATQQPDLDFTSDRMLVYLRPPVDTTNEQPETPPVTHRLVSLLDKGRQQLAEVFPAAQGEGRVVPSRAVDVVQNPSPAAREPVRIVAEGNARATMPRYDETGNLLTSRLMVLGPKFVINLEHQQLEVEGKGNLLVENYALAKAAARLASFQNPATLPAVKTSSPDNGLSQTVFTWHNAMLFILSEREAVFDGGVNMIHLSGGKIKFGDELASALGAKLDLLKAMSGREATLNCDSLSVKFGEAAGAGRSQDNQWMQRAKLDNLIAEGKMVSLEEFLNNGGTNFLTCGRLHYNGQRDTFVVQGSPNNPARIVTQENAQAPPKTNAADNLYWDRANGTIKIQNIRGASFQ